MESSQMAGTSTAPELSQEVDLCGVEDPSGLDDLPEGCDPGDPRGTTSPQTEPPSPPPGG